MSGGLGRVVVQEVEEMKTVRKVRVGKGLLLCVEDKCEKITQ